MSDLLDLVCASGIEALDCCKNAIQRKQNPAHECLSAIGRVLMSIGKQVQLMRI
jgi:hypothetical protein